MHNESRELVIKALDPDAGLEERHEAFGRLVHAFQDWVYACAYAILGDLNLAEDAAQEAFITAWKKLHQLRHPEAFSGWLRRIVRTECNRVKRKKGLQVVRLDDVVWHALAADDLQAETEKEELRKRLFASIAGLPENERTVVVLFYLTELSQHKIGQFLEIPTTTVAKRLYSARGRLRNKLPAECKKEFMANRPSRNRSFQSKVGAGIYDEYVGRYKFTDRPELTVSIEREGNKLISRSSGQRNELLSQGETASELFTKEFDGKGEFRRNKNGQITGFVYFEFGRELGMAEKIC